MRKIYYKHKLIKAKSPTVLPPTPFKGSDGKRWWGTTLGRSSNNVSVCENCDRVPEPHFCWGFRWRIIGGNVESKLRSFSATNGTCGVSSSHILPPLLSCCCLQPHFTWCIRRHRCRQNCSEQLCAIDCAGMKMVRAKVGVVLAMAINPLNGLRSENSSKVHCLTNFESTNSFWKNLNLIPLNLL